MYVFAYKTLGFHHIDLTYFCVATDSRPDKPERLKYIPNGEPYCAPLQAVVEAYSTVNSANGYSRWYTILVSTSAALLIAAMVWQPPLETAAARQLDYCYFDFALSPTKTAAWDGDPVLFWYWAKVMFLSGLIGLIVRTALMYNLSVPELTVQHKHVKQCKKRTTGLHKVVSTLAQLGLSLLIGCYCIHILMLYSAWEYTRAYL
jgi:hypothetical protein